MKKSMALLLCLCFGAPAYAAVGIKEVLIRKDSPNVNIRVVVNNPDGPTAQGPFVVKLYVRESKGDKWRIVKTWNDISTVKAGNEVARDFFDENSHTLSRLAKMPGFQARAVVDGPGVHQVERTSIMGNN